MEHIKKILKFVLLAAILLLRSAPHHEHAAVPANITEGITHTFFSLAAECTGSTIKFWGCRLSE